MFKEITEQIRQLTEQTLVPAPEQFTDPVAKKTNWAPTLTVGASFRSYRLVEVSADRIEYRRTSRALLFCSAFLLIGIVLIAYGLLNIRNQERSLILETILPILFGCLPVGLGISLLNAFNRPIAFDKTDGTFRKGRDSRFLTPNIPNAEPLKTSASLDDVHALQLLEKSVGHVRTYEINLILKNAQRVNVICHPDKYILRNQAVTLGKFLAVPVWDAISNTTKSMHWV